MMIRQINWDITGSNLAVWPSPVCADECFRRAGFEDFENSDEYDDEWDTDFQALLVRAISFAESHGPAIVRQFKGIKGIPNPSICEVLECSTLNDEFGVAVVEFGDPPVLALATADQHPIIWFVPCPNPEEAESLVEILANGLPIVRQELNWEPLAPDLFRTKQLS